MVWIFGKLIWIAFKMTWGFIQSCISSDHSDRAGDRRTGFCCPSGSGHNWNHYADMRNCGKIRKKNNNDDKNRIKLMLNFAVLLMIN